MSSRCNKWVVAVVSPSSSKEREKFTMAFIFYPLSNTRVSESRVVYSEKSKPFFGSERGSAAL